MKPGRVELALAAIAGLVALLATYAVTRLVQAWLYTEPDPSLVIWDTRIGMYWRLGISAYVGVMVAPLALRFAKRDPARTAGVLRVAMVLAGALIAVQALVTP